MNPDGFNDDDLKARFAGLRESEARQAPGFHRLVAEARELRSRRSTSPRPAFIFAPLSAAIVVALLFVPSFFRHPSLAEALPVLLPPSTDGTSLFGGRLFPHAAEGVPSDSLLPYHFKIRL